MIYRLDFERWALNDFERNLLLDFERWGDVEHFTNTNFVFS